MLKKFLHRSAFTLIELLVVIAVIAILSVVVILVLNPAQILMQSRDTNRLSDLTTMTEALSIYTAGGGTTIGSSSVIYVSLPDPVATSSAGDQCQGLALAPLPPSYTYHCGASSTYRMTDGTGWVPVNFRTLAGGSPLGQLPIDPVNTSSSRNYLTYATDGSLYEVTAPIESNKYRPGGTNDLITNDGGVLSTVYEKGTKLGLQPLDYGDTSLVGYWPLNEGTGTIAYDWSGNNATGSWNGAQVGSIGYYSAGKVGSFAGAFDGTSTYAKVPSAVATYGSNFTISAWVYTSGLASEDIASVNRAAHNNEWLFLLNANGTLTFWDYVNGYGFSNTGNASQIGSAITSNGWYQVGFVKNGTAGTYYINGNSAGSVTAAGGNLTFPSTNFTISQVGSADGSWNGLIDDVRIYNRSLSASEMSALFNGGK